MKIIYGLFLIIASFFLSGCSGRIIPEKLPDNVKSSLAYLPENPQFVMYTNFKNMRTTEFWKKNISDSLFASERTFGNLLYTFKEATGATMSEGLDEMFFANSWEGENAIVLKGSFDKNKMTGYLANDSLFRKEVKPNGIVVYIHNPSNLYFFLKDNFTLCASNYQGQIDYMMGLTDTSKTGLLNNSNLMEAINSAVYKENFWIVTAEKTFIRGIFVMFTEFDKDKDFNDSLVNRKDSVTKSEDILTNKIHENINSFSLSGKMKEDVDIVAKFECIDEKSSDYLYKLFSGILTIAKLSSAGDKKNVRKSAALTLVENIRLDKYNKSMQAGLRITNENISSMRGILK